MTEERENLILALASTAKAVEARLAAHLDKIHTPRLAEAMRYAVLGEGKRIRPFLVLQSAALFDAGENAALDVAASLECVHCYSLIHDDLPSMDDDDLRRGKPALHIAFDEATAILAGDALLTLAFEILAQAEIAAQAKAQLVLELAQAAGAQGMVGGQMRDLAAEGRFDDCSGPLAEKEILQLQGMKTGALIRYAMRAGAVLGGANETQLAALTSYGEALGLLFQLADDLVDATGSQEQAGKAVAKDEEKGKATLVSLLGVEGARVRLEELGDEAQAQLDGFEKADALRALPNFLAIRVLNPLTPAKAGVS